MNYAQALDSNMVEIILCCNKLWHIQLMQNINNTDYIIVIWWWSDAVIVIICLGFIHHPDLLYTNQNISEICSVLIFMERSIKKFLLVQLLFFHENVQQSRHCVTHFHLRWKQEACMKHQGLHTRLGWWTKCKWITIIIEKIILSNSHQAYHISAVSNVSSQELSMRYTTLTAMIIKIAVYCVKFLKTYNPGQKIILR